MSMQSEPWENLLFEAEQRIARLEAALEDILLQTSTEMFKEKHQLEDYVSGVAREALVKVNK
jgi:hypothetical protein